MPKTLRINNKRCTFQNDWLDRQIHPDLFWIRKSSTSSTEAHCNVCARTFDISNMGISAVNSHANGKKHRDRVQAKLQSTQYFSNLKVNSSQIEKQPSLQLSERLFSDNTNTENIKSLDVSETKNTVKSPTNQKMTSYVVKDDVIRAEILWTLQYIYKHSSARSASDSTHLFPLMFPDSTIAKKLQLGRTKLGYAVTHGLGPFFQDELSNAVRQCQIYNISFDKT